MKVVFKNLEPSEVTRDIAEHKILGTLDKFPHLKIEHVRMTLEMQNSPLQTGPDLFTAALTIFAGKYKGIQLSSSSANMYKALAQLSDNLLERLNRLGDKRRVRRLRTARAAKQLNIVVDADEDAAV